jgi:hypothetical protein
MPRKKSAAIASEMPPMEPTSKSPEEIIQNALESTRESMQRRLDDVIAHTQDHPQEALLYALGTGYALRMLPTVRILSAVTGLAIRLIKPAVLIYGASKLWHLVQKNGADGQSRQSF